MARPLAPPPPYAPAPVTGSPATGTPAGTVWIAAVAGVLVVGLVVAVAVLAMRPTSVTVASPAPVTTTRTVVPAPADVSDYRNDTTTTVPDDETTNAALIDEGVAADRAQVETLVGSWVPQLSSKRVGTVADGITYDSAAILGHYNGLSARYRPVLLLDSGGWPVFR
ncbi:MAG TPA: hypothetical protein VNP37_22140, partial [Actinomycetospora sp.]|nr:hypothetical protein [Actinomycetospora sp.]